MEELEVLLAIKDVLDIVVKDNSDDTGELTTVLTTLTDGEYGNNDLEKILMYDDKNSVYDELSSRLEVIDTRLDWTNKLLCEGFGLLGTFAVVLIGYKFLVWLYRSLGV